MVQYRHNSPYYELHLSELEDDTVRVLAFEGIENISRLFKYSFHLLSEDAQLNAEDILNKKATFVMNRGDEDPLTICGIISRFEQRGQSPDYVSYYAELVPKMWRLGLTFQSRIFQNMDIEKMVTEVLETAELSGDDFEFQLNETYPELEFAVQYRESDFDFINRRLEHFGIYYYFEHRDENDVIVFTDANDNLPKIDTGEEVLYNPNKDPLSEIETVSQFIYQGQVVTGKTQLKDYNYREPSKDLLSESQISEDSPGTYSNYGDHYKDENEGQFLARVRNEEIICNSVNYKGKSDCRLLRAGYKFTMGEHFREDWNLEYLLTRVLTRGNQRGLFGILQPQGKVEPTYENYFEALPPDIIFRPKRLTQYPKIHGILNAKIDSTNDGEQAEIDDQGRYKVILPFDLSGKANGEASHYIRMIQPYAGPNYGTHFPLHKDTEVLLTFIDGNPDRPIISGAIPNPETISPVTNKNQTKSVIRDNYGNEIIMDGTPGNEHIRLYSPHHKSGLELGRSEVSWTESDNQMFTAGNSYAAGIGNKGDYYIGNFSEVLAGSFQTAVLGLASSWFVGVTTDFRAGEVYDLNLARTSEFIKTHKDTQAGGDIFQHAKKDQVLGAGSQICLAAGTTESNLERSLINIYPGKIMLTSGGGKVVHKTGGTEKEYAEGKQLWNDIITDESDLSMIQALVFSGMFCALGFIIPLVHEIIDTGINPHQEETPPEHVTDPITGEVTHTPPPADPVGPWVDLSSTISGGALGIIPMVLGAMIIGQQIKNKKAAAKLPKKAEYVEPVEHTEPTAKIELEKEGKIRINSNGKKGGIIIKSETKPIDLKVGEKSRYSFYKDYMELYSGKDGKSQIVILKSGDIELVNNKGSGSINMDTNNNILMNSLKNIKLFSNGGFISLEAPNGQVKASGHITHKNFKVLAL